VASRPQQIEKVVLAAHRRYLMLLYLEQGAIAASFVFAGCALILILGTQLLNWYWLAVLGGAGAVTAAIRVRRRRSSAYLTAQTLDARLALFDTVSTAWHVLRTPGLAASPAGRMQVEQAETLAAEIDPDRVFPVKLERTWAFALALGAVALALFSIRYLVQRDMNLSRALVPLHLEQLTAALRNEIGVARRPDSAPPLSGNQQNEGAQNPKAQGSDPRMNDVLGMKNPAEAPSKEDGVQSASPKTKATDDGHSPVSGKSTSGENSSDSSSNASSKNSAHASSKGNEQDSQSQKGSSNDQNDSLMSKMKDAVSSFMAQMKPDNPSESPQSSSQNSAAPDQDQTQNENGQSQSQTSASQSAQAQTKSDAKSSAQAQATEMSQAGDSRKSGNSENKDGNQSKSGVGKQDGGKEVKLAQEQEAMGKLAEIIGKRSRDVSGEMMVEVPSGRQQLKTSYTGEVAHHSDTGGEINRDEVPVALQPYVREYMERVRRNAAGNQPAKSK
jgi:hypothetical protein